MDCDCKYCKEKYVNHDAALKSFASGLPLPASITEQIETIKAATDNAIKNGTAKQFLIDAGII